MMLSKDVQEKECRNCQQPFRVIKHREEPSNDKEITYACPYCRFDYAEIISGEIKIEKVSDAEFVKLSYEMRKLKAWNDAIQVEFPGISDDVSLQVASRMILAGQIRRAEDGLNHLL